MLAKNSQALWKKILENLGMNVFLTHPVYNRDFQLSSFGLP